MNFDPDKASAWFAREVQPHEPILRAWLQSQFSSDCEVDDIVQEAFLRVWQAHKRGELRSPKAFLFATARNLTLNGIRRRRLERANSLVEIDGSSVLESADDIPETVARNQELAVLTQAIQSLPERCRDAFTLRKVYGLSQKEIAARLGISEHTVSAQLTIGLRKCIEFFARHGIRKGGPR